MPKQIQVFDLNYGSGKNYDGTESLFCHIQAFDQNLFYLNPTTLSRYSYIIYRIRISRIRRFTKLRHMHVKD